MRNLRIEDPADEREIFLVVPDDTDDIILGETEPMLGELHFEHSVREPANLADLGELQAHVARSSAGETRITVGAGTHYEVTMLTADADRAGRLDGSDIVFAPGQKSRERWDEGALRIIPGRIRFLHDPNTDPIESRVHLPLVRVHRPNRTGCEVVCTITNTTSTEVEASFEFGGLGGGGSTSFEETVQTKYPARTACQERVLPADLIIEYGWTFIGNNPVSYGSRFRIVQVYDRPELRDLPPSLDMCGRTTIADNQDPRLHRLYQSSDGDEVTTAIGAEISGYVSMGVDLGATPLKMGTKFSRSTKYSWQNTATLVGGMNYIEYSPTPSNPLERCWSVTSDPLEP